MPKIKVRNCYGKVNEVVEFDDAISIVGDDGRSIFDISINEDGALDVRTGMTCKHNDKILDMSLSIKPNASNVVKIVRDEYIPQK